MARYGFHEKADVKADWAANRCSDQPPTGLASIRTLVGLSFEPRCMMMSARFGAAISLPASVGLAVSRSHRNWAVEREAISPSAGPPFSPTTPYASHTT